MSVRVIIADDDASIREVITELLDDEQDLVLVGAASGAEEAIRLCVDHRPDVALLDIRMPEGGGRRVAQVIGERGLGTKIVGLSANESSAIVREMFRLGASGYVVKGASGEEIVEAVKRAARGQLSVSADLAIAAFGELIQDVDDCERIEVRLREGERRFRALLDAGRSAVVIFDANGRIQTANVRSEELFALPRGELVGKSVEDLVPEHLRATLEQERISFVTAQSERWLELEAVTVARRRDGADVPVDAALISMACDPPLWLATFRDVTERRAAEAEQRDALERAVGILEALPEAVVALDEQSRIAFANPRAEALFGYDRGELVGKRGQILLPQSLRARYASRRAELRAPGVRTLADPDLQGHRKDGTTIGIESSLNTATIANASTMVTVIRDVTERRRQDEEQRRREARLRGILDAAPDALVVVDAGGTIRMVNAQTERLFGYGREELVGRSVDDLLPERLAALHARHRQGYSLDPQVREMGVGLVLAGRRCDGGEVPVDVSLSPLETEEGSLVVAAIRDVTGRRKAEERARKEEERFRQVVESSPDGTVIVDLNGRVQVVNRQMERMFGYPAEQLVGRQIETLLPEHLREVHRERRTVYQADPRARTMDAGLALLGLRHDGTEFPIDVSLAPLHTDDGVVTVAHVRDLSERRRVEQRLLLSRLVRAQEDERLRIASDIHDDTIQAITAAGLRLQRLKRRLTDDAQRDELEKVEAVVQMAISGLRHLMFELRPPALAEEGLTCALRTYLEQFHADTGIHPDLSSRTTREPPLEPSVLLYRTAQELLVNVRKHASARSVRVEIQDTGGGYLLLVSDDGQGFPLGQPETKPGHLGLVALRERVSMAGGWCRFESEPGSGATVTVWVPAGPSEDAGGGGPAE